jgi:small subunit ribosomal protein S3Ae
MAVGKNKKLGKARKGSRKKVTDPFSKKEWYDVRAPSVFPTKTIGKTIVTKTTGTKVARDGLLGRLFEVSLGDLKPDGEDEAFRKFLLKVEEVNGMNCLTQFHGMDLTTDKLRSLVRKWQTLIEAHADVKTSDGYSLRLFCIGFTKKRTNQNRKTSYAQSAQVRQIRKKMVDIMARETAGVDLNGLVEKLISEIIGKEIEKHTQSIYPLQNVLIRKVKVLRSPKVDVSKLMEMHGGAEALAQAAAAAAKAQADAGQKAQEQTKSKKKAIKKDAKKGKGGEEETAAGEEEESKD